MSSVSKYADKHPFDYFITVGDNIYERGIKDTKDKNFDKAMDLVREHSNLKKQPMYSVLGNHDCYGNPMAQV